MTKREYKRAAKAACEANGLKIPMIHMTLLEAGADQYGALYVMFSDKRTGKEYQCRRNRQDWTWSACECEQTTTPETPAEAEAEAPTETEQDTKGTRDTQSAPAPAITIEQVAEALAENQSAEFEQETVVYWLHVTESGEIVHNYSLADNDFCYEVSYDRYGITGQEGNPQKIYDTETMSNPIFAEIVQNLTERANLWLEQVRTEEAIQDTTKKYFFEFDEIWGENPSECVEELERMSDALGSLYMTLGPGMYERSIDERTEAKSQRMKEILKKYGCHVYRLHETYLDLKTRGELELYIKYRKEMGSL